MKRIKVAIAGGAGYTGGELIRILLGHPAVDIAGILSQSNAGKPVAHVHTDLAGDTALTFDAVLPAAYDVLFLCVGHGEAAKFLAAHSLASGARVIDLSQDFRLLRDGAAPVFEGDEFVYGLPELQRDRIRRARHIANPGCFATAIQLGLLPLAAAGGLGPVYTTGITGSTGAGQSLSPTSHFSWRANNIQAYKTLSHQHSHEIKRTLNQLQPGFDRNGAVYFVPWRGDFTRGIFASSQLETDRDLAANTALFENFYRDHPFTHVVQEPLALKQVVNTNKCLVQLEQSGRHLVVHTAIDNLTKGASGQAVQNMNLIFGLDETEGLKLKSPGF